MRPTKFTTVTLNQSSVTDSDEALGWVEHSHCAIERPDVIESECKGVNQCQWRTSEERGGYGPRGSKSGSLIGGEFYLDLGHGRLDFWENERATNARQ